MKKYLPKYLWILFLILLSTPAIKRMITSNEVMPLGGAIEKEKPPTLGWNNWIKGEFQKEQESYTVQNFGFHSVFIRLINQWDYSVWGKLRPKHVVLGNDNSLIGRGYIDGMYGKENAAQIYKLDRKKEAILTVVNAFREKGKDVVFMVQPGKPYLSPEQIPNQLLKLPSNDNIYDSFLEWSKNEKLTVIDFQKYFLDQKGSIPYPIFPRLGTHLSEYAETIVLDSILHFIEKQTGKDIYDYKFGKTVITNTPRGRDNDTEQALNLFYTLESEPLAYRYFQVESVDKDYVPNVLVIGDSFYWGLYSIINNNKLFGNHQFWYRNRSIFPTPKGNKSKVSNVDTAMESLEIFDMVFIIVTAIALQESGWEYFERIDTKIKELSE